MKKESYSDAVVATMALSSVSVFAAKTETTTDFERPTYSMNMKVKDGNFKFGKRLELTEEQKAAIAEKNDINFLSKLMSLCGASVHNVSE